FCFFFSSRRRHTRFSRDWSSDVCSSDLHEASKADTCRHTGRFPMRTIDGSYGEGGGQILRTALSLSVCFGEPFRIANIRPRRSPPGLRPQHLAAVHAAAAISDAEVVGAAVASQELTFTPKRAAFGDFEFSIGTAGSTTLVLQTLLPSLITAPGPSTVLIEGGTHNPKAPTYEFLACAFLPLVERMGPTIRPELIRAGFYPRGGGA